MAALSRLDRFTAAMESIYGSLTTVDPHTWTPPAASGGHRGRYLWTDAFGVLNLLTMHKEKGAAAAAAATAQATTGSDRYLVLAKQLVHAVHETLGRTRDGSARLPGASDANPLGGGLRIGKLDATGPDGDGQYHHYLTIWMFALNRLALAAGEPKYNAQAVALAKAIHPKFFFGGSQASSRPRLVWKMDVDLSNPLVASEGNLDPIDGYVVFRLLQDAAEGTAKSGEESETQGRVLVDEIADYQRIMARKGEHFVSSDPLDLGMTLWTAHWYAGEPWAANLAGKCFQQICKSYLNFCSLTLFTLTCRLPFRGQQLSQPQHQAPACLP
ncbi:hypothetical protein ASPZODRAFT_131161 [Penicilliopsis zonata CBS 506.65]|uniref:Uncharacterized protein n=1 Tax=Penicilliopsis zonata CBS 506.65 TaxID=1073090 RepID=A0A1L9SK58_9EURO|nr:hypothetical protein ASPZODRAFT_131161 [Penicilliopsis zonata CBS 506.65]OJJ47619.1 hypothetical protein ASPZODRAFT_131161 [Penicilliopsis zonata CBS 506.65]